ncbi:hypothetical protein RhiJN_10650 [Ceratobasidium sp. AG-Ba]|nr:hypothetical protein RhiJN_10650 [Ceratobasidium sp. AG-Ba]QRW11390.1 hypothetical protein RhiLY_10389 [Ceratobasidium sp. AG-Ba]
MSSSSSRTLFSRLPKLISTSISTAVPDAAKVVVHNARYHRCTPPTTPVLGSDDPAPGMYQLLQTASGVKVVVPPAAANASFEESIRMGAYAVTDPVPRCSGSKDMPTKAESDEVKHRRSRKAGVKAGSKKLNPVKALVGKRATNHDIKQTKLVVGVVQDNVIRAVASRLRVEGAGETKQSKVENKRSGGKRAAPAPLNTALAQAYKQKEEECESPVETPGPVTPIDEEHGESSEGTGNGKMLSKTSMSNKYRRRGPVHIAGSRTRTIRR